jgi:hypothetical protein
MNGQTRALVSGLTFILLAVLARPPVALAAPPHPPPRMPVQFQPRPVHAAAPSPVGFAAGVREIIRPVVPQFHPTPPMPGVVVVRQPSPQTTVVIYTNAAQASQAREHSPEMNVQMLPASITGVVSPAGAPEARVAPPAGDQTQSVAVNAGAAAPVAHAAASSQSTRHTDATVAIASQRTAVATSGGADSSAGAVSLQAKSAVSLSADGGHSALLSVRPAGPPASMAVSPPRSPAPIAAVKTQLEKLFAGAEPSKAAMTAVQSENRVQVAESSDDASAAPEAMPAQQAPTTEPSGASGSFTDGHGGTSMAAWLAMLASLIIVGIALRVRVTEKLRPPLLSYAPLVPPG